VLLAPFGGVGGFVDVPLTFLATRRGNRITETAFLPGLHSSSSG
jgi:hypothetical protein